MKIRAFATALAILVSSAMPFAVETGKADAHVHGITPLLACSVDSSFSGGLRTDDTPAAAANDGPIVGLIPRDTGEAPLTIGDGGFAAAEGNCP